MFPQKNIVRDHWGSLLLCLSACIAASYGNCGAPLRLDFAIVADQFIGQDNFSVGADVTYTCIPGYIRVPGSKNVIYCLENSSWSTPEMFCQRKSCGPPEEIENGDVHIDDTLFGSRVNYTCHIGYNMISKRPYRECLADGKWSNENPVCEVQSCAPPGAITDGTFSPENEDYVYLNTVTYQCKDKKFALIGETYIFCTAYGNWSSDAPKCVAVECSSPDVANSAKLSGFAGPYYYNFVVSFECLKGFTMKGASLVKCNVSSQWDPPLPTCYAMPSCAPPNTITNGSFSPVKGEYAYQDVVTYKCNENFALIGQPSVTCTSDGNWSSDAPKCVAMPSCAPPNTITNGSFSPVKGEYAYRDVVTYKCNENFALKGQPSVTCSSYGNWSSDAPKCVAMPSCAPPNTITNGSFSPVKGEYAYQDVVTYKCNENFTLKGQSSVICTSYGNWSSDAPKCHGNNVADAMGNNVAEVMGNSMVILTMMLVGHLISHHF